MLLAIDVGNTHITVGLFQATARPGHLFQLVQLQLERLRLPGRASAELAASRIGRWPSIREI